MKKQILILIVFVISMMACSESATLRPNVVVNKQTFTMNIDGKDWVADSTSLVVSPFSNNYTMAVGIKFSDKVKKIPAETYYLYVPDILAGESVQLPSKTYSKTIAYTVSVL